MPCTLNDWADIATIIAAVAAIGVLWYTARQVYSNTQISRGQFWLELEKMFSSHDDVHLKLRPGGEWAENDKGPSTPKDWIALEDYMGLFEHCEIMFQKGLIDVDTFQSIFAYRLQNLVANKLIVRKKLIDEKDSWKKFHQLLARLSITVPKF